MCISTIIAILHRYIGMYVVTLNKYNRKGSVFFKEKPEETKSPNTCSRFSLSCRIKMNVRTLV